MQTISSRLAITLSVGFAGAVGLGLLAPTASMALLGIVVLGLLMVSALAFYVVPSGMPDEAPDLTSPLEMSQQAAWDFPPPQRNKAKLLHMVDYRRD